MFFSYIRKNYICTQNTFNTSMKKLYICILLIIFHGFYFSLSGKNGIDNTIKVNLSGKIYKQFSFLITEEIRSDIDFTSTNWLFSTVEFNYKITPWLKTGAAYVHILNTHKSERNKNRYILYVGFTEKYFS